MYFVEGVEQSLNLKLRNIEKNTTAAFVINNHIGKLISFSSERHETYLLK
jgi:hypothetical protein